MDPLFATGFNSNAYGRTFHILILFLAVGSSLSCGGGSPAQTHSSLSIVTTNLADGMVSFPYSQTIQEAGGSPPFSWSIVSGGLPNNIILGGSASSTANLSGTPTTAQMAALSIQVKDASGQTAVQAYSFTIQSLGVAQLQPLAGTAPSGAIEIQSVGAGPFNPASWQNATLNWVADVRNPLFVARTTGPWQNIYSPWPLMQTGGWLMFYGGWDGSNTPNDRVYDVFTPDFVTFGSRTLVIDHGVFQHVNNVNVTQLTDGSMHMICTVLPDPTSLDKPAYFSSPDGVTWNGVLEPYSAQASDVVQVTNDNRYGVTDYNGGNVLLWDNNMFTLYYSSGISGSGQGEISRASSLSPPLFQSLGGILATSRYSNDVRKFQVGGQNWYVMALYTETSANPRVYYALSNDGISFGQQQVLLQSSSVLDENLETPAFLTNGNSILGVVYGGFATGPCCTSAIFGRWLQKAVSITDSSGVGYVLQGGYGPDRQWFQISSPGQVMITVYAEDGVTPLAKGTVNVTSGQAYQLIIQ